MTCNEFWNGEEHTMDHLSECPACAARLAQQERMAAGLNALGWQMRRVEAPARVERALVGAFRGRTALHSVEPRGGWWLAGIWATALAATALLAIVLARPHAPERTRQQVRSRTQLAAIEQTVDRADFAAAPSYPEAGDSGFLALPNVDAVGPTDEMNLVRVEVPRSAMIPLGFAVPADRAGETVEADVMLDADGVARAVRFLDSGQTARESSW